MKYQGISILKRPHCNTWYARYRSGGKQFYVSAKTQQECYDKLKLALKKAHSQELKKLQEPEQKVITFLEWYQKWLSLYKKDVKESTVKEYSICLKHLSTIHHLPINKITSIQILEELNKITGNRQKQKVYEFARAIFEKAQINELIFKNPVDKIDKPKHKRINGLAFSNEDEKTFVKLCREQNQDIFLICLYQGLRRGEVLALTSDDFDFERKTLRINKSISFKNEVDSTKNIYSNRVMPLFEKSIPIFKKYEKINGRLFNYSLSKCDALFRKLAGNFDAPYTIHSLRHTFITKCQELNIPLHIIQKWVGHNIGSDVTQKVYTHSRDNAEAENIKLYNLKN